MGDVFVFRTGDSGIDALLAGVFRQRHPQEAGLPCGCRVMVTMSFPELAVKLSQDLDIRMSYAEGLARRLLETPCEVLGFEDLTDGHDAVKAYASIVDDEGHMYIMEPRWLRRI